MTDPRRPVCRRTFEDCRCTGGAARLLDARTAALLALAGLALIATGHRINHPKGGQ